MAASVARRSGSARPGVADAKQRVLQFIAEGFKVEEAMAKVGRSPETYKEWRKTDGVFRDAVARLREIKAGGTIATSTVTVPDFPEFCRDWLKQPLDYHQLLMWDVIRQQMPREMRACFQYQQGTPWEPHKPGNPAGRTIINLPPGHAKTTTWSVNWATWLIHRDPDIKIVIICKDQGLAIQILGAIKFRLTSPVYREMHMRFAPEGGWKDPDNSWNQTAIYVQGRGSGEKDPTVQTLGINGRIYGARSDVVIGDDMVTLQNVNEHEKQRHFIEQEVESRLDGHGLLLMLGTRVAPTDLYKVMREVEDFDEQRVYTYFAMPAVLDEGDGTPEQWEPLWPARFTPKVLRKIRRDERTWALVYQQQDVAEDATFNAKAVAASVNSQRFPGPLKEGAMGHRQQGMSGLYVIGGLDPATVGATSMMVMAVDKQTGKRYILDGFNKVGCSPNLMRETIERLTITYSIHEWVIERNAYQRAITQDASLLQFLRSRGCRLTEHFTNENKRDPDFGIPAMAQLFLTCGVPPSNGGDGDWRKTPETALIELPNPRQNAWVAEYINQMVVWEPSGMKQRQKTDLVMAAWFCEIAAQRIVNRGKDLPTHLPNKHLPAGRRKAQGVINMQEYRESLAARRAG